MSSDEAQAATPHALVAMNAIQALTDRKADPALVAFYRRCLEMADEVDRRRANRAKAEEEDSGVTCAVE